jgi:hypothetical protein
LRSGFLARFQRFAGRQDDKLLQRRWPLILGGRFIVSQASGDLVHQLVVRVRPGMSVRLACPMVGKTSKPADHGFVLITFVFFKLKYFYQRL